MRTALTAAAAVVTAAAAVYAIPATSTTNVAAVRPAAPAAPAVDQALLDAEPIYHVVTDLHLLLEAEPIYPELMEPEHDHSTHVHEPSRPMPHRLTYGRWRTPEAAMRHLVRAYNAQDREALKDVTTPAAREMLDPMRSWAPDLRLVKCVASDGGYDCFFTHAYANGTGTGRGEASLQVRPALKQGWYATLVIECG